MSHSSHINLLWTIPRSTPPRLLVRSFCLPDVYQTLLDPTDDLTPSPVWGQEVPPLVLSTDEELRDLIRELTVIHKRVMEQFPANSVDNFKRFYADFKKHNLPFASFFTRYLPAFRQGENCIGQAVEVLDQARTLTRWPSLVSHAYLAACRYNNPPAWNQRIFKTWRSSITKEYKDAEQVLMDKKLKHVLAVIRIKVLPNAQNTERQGYILIDQGYSWVRPAVLMFDGKPPHDDVLTHDAENRLNLLLNNSYAHWTYLHKDQSSTHLIYLRRPFCSFLPITEKLALVRNVHFIFERDSNGINRGGLQFRMTEVQANAVSQQHTAWLFYQRENDAQGVEDRLDYLIAMVHKRLMDEKILENAQLDHRENLETTRRRIVRDRSVIATIEDTLSLGAGRLLALLREIALILKDAEFVAGCTDMQKMLKGLERMEGKEGRVGALAKRALGKLTNLMTCSNHLP